MKPVHVAPPGADWVSHPVDQFCLGHLQTAKRGERGHIVGGLPRPDPPARAMSRLLGLMLAPQPPPPPETYRWMRQTYRDDLPF
jgi:hypothetical protein